MLKAELLKNKILASLPQRESSRLLPGSKLLQIRPNDVLFRPGERLRYVYFPVGAVISLVASTRDGRDVAVSVTGREGLIGIRTVLGSNTHGYMGVVLTPGECLRARADVLRAEFKRGGVLQDRVLAYLRYLLVQISQTAACNRVHALDKRLARWLLMIQSRVQEREFQMTHEVLSTMVGAPRSEVTIAAGMLRKAGLIRYTRGRITLLDRRGLESVACECYRVVADELRSVK